MPVTRIWRPITIALAASLAALAPFAGLGDKGPTASESASPLKDEIDIALSASRTQDIKVIDDATLDIPCDQDKAKHRYAVTATRYYPGLDAPTELVDAITGRLLAVSTLIKRRVEPGDEPTSTLHDKKYHTTITVSSPGRGQIQIIGITDCLRTG